VGPATRLVALEVIVVGFAVTRAVPTLFEVPATGPVAVIDPLAVVVCVV